MTQADGYNDQEEIAKLRARVKDLGLALCDMTWQFAYDNMKNGKDRIINDGGLSALEIAFDTLGFGPGGITWQEFEKVQKEFEDM